MKIPPTFLKYFGLFLIIAAAIAWPISQLTWAKSEPITILGLSWGAIIISGLSFYASAQDGVEIDEILDNQEKILKLLKDK